jgi:hypothetical protein
MTKALIQNEFSVSKPVFKGVERGCMSATCQKCKTEIDPFLAIAIVGGIICSGCLTKPSVSCSHCGKGLSDNTIAYNHDGIRHCADCATLFDNCYSCMRLTFRADMKKTAENHDVCHTCSVVHYFEFHKCNKTMHRNRAHHISKFLLCTGCYSTHSFCRVCRLIVHRDDFIEGAQACRLCIINAIPIKPYKTKVQEFCMCWHMDKCGVVASTLEPQPKLPYLGVELEVEVNGEKDERGRMLVHPAKIDQIARQILTKMAGFAILKSDSSINHGFEIVSAPATLPAQKVKWESFFNWCESQSELPISAFDTTTCGMHVHISRSCLTTLQIGKMIDFMYNPANNGFIRIIAQRNPQKYAENISRRTIKDCSRERQIIFRQMAAANKHVRHTALNTVPKNTVEIRIFKATTNRDGFFANLEFCQALVDFCASGTVSIEHSKDWQHFCKFVNANHKSYPYLHKFLANNRLVPRVFNK